MTEREQIEAGSKEIAWLHQQLEEAKAGAREVRAMLGRGEIMNAYQALEEMGEELE